MDLFDNFSKMADNMGGIINKDIDINQIMNSELNGAVDFGLWMETIEIQRKFNNSVAPGWETDVSHARYDYWMAVTDEAVEVLGSKHWKWWKDKDKMGVVDWDNVLVELTDLFLFVMSIAIQQKSQHVIFQQLVALEIGKTPQDKIRDEEFFDDFRQRFMMAINNESVTLVSVFLVEFWFRAGGDAEMLFRTYRIKSALNEIRQEFGYGVKYHKMWKDNITGELVEDNVIANRISKDIPLDENMIKNTKEALKKYYLTHVAI